MPNNDALGIELVYKNGDQRLLLSSWRVRNVGKHGDGSMWLVVAGCTCWSDLSSMHTCESHAGAWRFRVVDVRSPVGPLLTVR